MRIGRDISAAALTPVIRRTIVVCGQRTVGTVGDIAEDNAVGNGRRSVKAASLIIRADAVHQCHIRQCILLRTVVRQNIGIVFRRSVAVEQHIGESKFIVPGKTDRSTFFGRPVVEKSGCVNRHSGAIVEIDRSTVIPGVVGGESRSLNRSHAVADQCKRAAAISFVAVEYAVDHPAR